MLSPVRRAMAAVLVPAGLAAALLPASPALAATHRSVLSAGATTEKDQDETLLLQSARAYATALGNLPGPALEQAFLTGMIPHHAAAVAMARQELARGSRPELKAMARNIISTQSKEISRMTGWLHTWYALTPESARVRVPHTVQQLGTPITTWMDTATAQLSTVPPGARFDQAFSGHDPPPRDGRHRFHGRSGPRDARSAHHPGPAGRRCPERSGRADAHLVARLVPELTQVPSCRR